MKNPQSPGRDNSLSSLFWKFSPWSPLQTRSPEGQAETHETTNHEAAANHFPNKLRNTSPSKEKRIL
jgi:hypothetical protein